MRDGSSGKPTSTYSIEHTVPGNVMENFLFTMIELVRYKAQDCQRDNWPHKESAVSAQAGAISCLCLSFLIMHILMGTLIMISEQH